MVIEGFEGDIARETKVDVTVTCVEAVTVPAEAVMMVVPVLNALTIPALPVALLTVATDGTEELQMTEAKPPLPS